LDAIEKNLNLDRHRVSIYFIPVNWVRHS